MLLAEDGQHLGAGLGADEGALGHLRKQGGVIPGRGGAQLLIAVKVEGVVEHGVGKAQLFDAGVDGIQPQIINDHVGGDVIRANDHHGGRVFHLELCSHAQSPQHSGAVHKVLRLILDLLGQAGLAPAGL